MLGTCLGMYHYEIDDVLGGCSEDLQQKSGGLDVYGCGEQL